MYHLLYVKPAATNHLETSRKHLETSSNHQETASNLRQAPQTIGLQEVSRWLQAQFGWGLRNIG